MKRVFVLAVLLAACRPSPPAALDATPPESLTTRLQRTDFTFTQWRADLGREPNTADLAQLLDAIATAQKHEPARTFALSQDAELRQRVLRVPDLRARAAQVLGMTAPDGVPVPSVDQLLHTRPGDNCPTCRMRAQMQNAGNGL